MNYIYHYMKDTQ